MRVAGHYYPFTKESLRLAKDDLPAENAILDAIRLLSEMEVPLNEITVPMKAATLLQGDDSDNALERIQSQFSKMLLRGGLNQV